MNRIPKKKTLLLAFFLGIFFIPAKAQKILSVQKISLRAPADIKVDGKTTEWDNKFQAYNPANRIFYTLSNDDDNLYLTVASTNDGYCFSKILYGGITFTIQKGSKELKNIAITYPTVVKSLKGPIIDRDNALRGFVKFNDTTKSDVKKKRDSLVSIISEKLNDLFKEVKVEGIAETQEPLISIYNAEGIKLSAQYNNHLQYVYELAIPLKYLNSTIKNGEKLRYNIRLNGRPAMPGEVIYDDMYKSLGPDNMYVYTFTDLDGEYTLSKK